ncbi:MAG: DUF86 domain-containing protein [Candidatus Poribacteria bacterium]|nr:DUF86 domain-containing protein [Candidatus Poribacteria bacterium]
MTNYLLYLKNISEAMVAAQAFVGGMGFDAFVVDDKTASAVLQKLKIVEEAAKKVPETIRQDYPQVPWQQMARIRDQIVHAYFAVDYAMVWDTLKIDIPSMQTVIQQILEDMEEEQVHEQ